MWKRGKANGNGWYFLANGDVYKGEMKDGKYCGHGVLLYANGAKYDG